MSSVPEMASESSAPSSSSQSAQQPSTDLSPLLELPRELRDNIYSFLTPNYRIRFWLKPPHWHDTCEDHLNGFDPDLKAELPSGRTTPSSHSLADGEEVEHTGTWVSASMCSTLSGHADREDESVREREERGTQMAHMSLLLCCKTVSYEYLDCIGRETEATAYVCVENSRDAPYSFQVPDRFWDWLILPSVSRLIVLARWDAGEGWESEDGQTLMGEGDKGKAKRLQDDEDEPGAIRIYSWPLAPEPNHMRPPVPELEYTHSRRVGWNLSRPALGNDYHSAYYRGTTRDPARFLDMKNVHQVLFETVEAMLANLPNLNTLDVGFDIMNASSKELALVKKDKMFDHEAFLAWHPTDERIVHLIKTYALGDWKIQPAGIEERKRINGGWYDFVEDDAPDIREEQSWTWPHPNHPSMDLEQILLNTENEESDPTELEAQPGTRKWWREKIGEEEGHMLKEWKQCSRI